MRTSNHFHKLQSFEYVNTREKFRLASTVPKTVANQYGQPLNANSPMISTEPTNLKSGMRAKGKRMA